MSRKKMVGRSGFFFFFFFFQPKQLLAVTMLHQHKCCVYKRKRKLSVFFFFVNIILENVEKKVYNRDFFLERVGPGYSKHNYFFRFICS